MFEATAECRAKRVWSTTSPNGVGLSSSKTHRTLQTLMHAGYVERDLARGGFRPTMKMFEFGIREISRLDIRRIAPPCMSTLAKRIDETIHLSNLDQVEVIYIDEIESGQAARA
jgi:IclR family KDG regulon transcriptional repressor